MYIQDPQFRREMIKKIKLYIVWIRGFLALILNGSFLGFFAIYAAVGTRLIKNPKFNHQRLEWKTRLKTSSSRHRQRKVDHLLLTFIQLFTLVQPIYIKTIELCSLQYEMGVRLIKTYVIAIRVMTVIIWLANGTAMMHT